MTYINARTIRCTCGHEVQATYHESVNTQLSPDAVERFLHGILNCCECPGCRRQVRLLAPVLFNDMERNFMVYFGNTAGPDGSVDRTSGLPTVYAGNYLAALAAMAAFRDDPANAIVSYKDMTEERADAYVSAYLRLYEHFKRQETRAGTQ